MPKFLTKSQNPFFCFGRCGGIASSDIASFSSFHLNVFRKGDNDHIQGAIAQYIVLYDFAGLGFRLFLN